MRAVAHDRYGPPDVLHLEEVERPVPKDDEVLVKIHATSVTRTDCGWRSAKPFFVRVFIGLLRPKKKILGMELAGEVEAVGRAVSEFGVGDQVFGVTGFGANAEFVCVRESAALAHKPAGMSFEEAAAVCDGASIALAAMRKADLSKGRSIVIYGASGSIGTAAVQLAKYYEWDLPRDRPRVPVARPGARLADPVGRRQAGDTPGTQIHEGRGSLPQRVDRGREIQGRHRSALPIGAGVEATKYVETGQKTGNVVLTIIGESAT